MLKRLLVFAALALTATAALVGYAFLRPPAEASTPIAAIPLDLETPPPVAATPPPATATNPSVPASPTAEEEAAATVEAVAVEPTVEPAVEATPLAVSEPILFEIDPAASEVRYIIDEDLRGVPTTVVGTTNQVAGQIAVDPADPGGARVGIIQVNARTFVSDESRRDRAVQNRILSTDSFEFITFTPTTLSGLPPQGALGESITFALTGDLTIRDVTREVTWQVTLTPVSAARLEGQAVTAIQRADYNLTLPSVPFVANVSEEVRLEIDFVADAK